MRLFNTIVIFDVYTVANDAEEARKAVVAAIAEGASPTEITALEAKFESNIRASWRDQKPFVAADVSDEDFEKRVKGSTTFDLWKRLYTKQKDLTDDR